MSDENDPRNDAKKWLEQCRATTDVATKRQIAFVDHLNSEIDRLTNRVEELEEASDIVRRLATSKSVQEMLAIASDAEKHWAKMQKEATSDA